MGKQGRNQNDAKNIRITDNFEELPEATPETEELKRKAKEKGISFFGIANPEDIPKLEKESEEKTAKKKEEEKKKKEEKKKEEEIMKGLLRKYGFLNILWSKQDIKELAPTLSQDQVDEVADRIEQSFDAEVGVNWTVIEDAIEDLFPGATEEPEEYVTETDFVA